MRLQVGAEEVITGWFVETMAAERIRGSPIGPMLIRKALEDMPMNLSLGQTQQMRELQFAMGWKYVCSLTKYVFVSGYRMNLRNKLPIVVAESVAAAFGLQHNLRWRRERRVGGSGFRVGPIERFTDEHDELWKRMASTCTCAVVRDSSYMNWKYVDRPYRRFSCIELRKGSSLMGVLVAMVAEPNEVYPYRRGFLVDFVVPLDRRDLVARLVVEGIGALKRCGVQTIVCQSANVVLGAVLERFGFMARSPRHQFLVASGRGSDSMTRYLLEPKNWFLTLGDSDADAYPD